MSGADLLREVLTALDQEPRFAYHFNGARLDSYALAARIETALMAGSLGSKGGKAGTGAAKVRGDRAYYVAISKKAAKARAKKERK